MRWTINTSESVAAKTSFLTSEQNLLTDMYHFGSVSRFFSQKSMLSLKANPFLHHKRKVRGMQHKQLALKYCAVRVELMGLPSTHL